MGKSQDKEIKILPIKLPNGNIETTLRVFCDGQMIADIIFLSDRSLDIDLANKYAELAYENYTRNNHGNFH